MNTLETEKLIPSVDEIEQEFNFIKSQAYKNIPGVVIFDSGVDGPSVGITIMTHGNEPSGLACAWYFRKNDNLQKRLRRGKVVLVLNNLQAAEKYFKTKKTGNKEAVRQTRFIDLNMNRLPEELNEKSKASEVARGAELLPIWKTFDFGLDIHSTTQQSDPMIIPVGDFKPELYKGFPMEVIITNIENVQVGKPAVAFYGDLSKKIPTMVVETGSHEDPQALKRAIDCANNFLSNIGVIDDERGEIIQKHCRHYDVKDAMRVPNATYSLTRVFATYEMVRKGEIMARGNQGDITMPFDGHTLMGPDDILIRHPQEEVFFLSEPVKEIFI